MKFIRRRPRQVRRSSLKFAACLAHFCAHSHNIWASSSDVFFKFCIYLSRFVFLYNPPPPLLVEAAAYFLGVEALSASLACQMKDFAQGRIDIVLLRHDIPLRLMHFQ